MLKQQVRSLTLPALVQEGEEATALCIVLLIAAFWAGVLFGVLILSIFVAGRRSG